MSGKEIEAVEMYEVYETEKLRIDQKWRTTKIGGPYRRMYEAKKKKNEREEEDRKTIHASEIYWGRKYEVYIKPTIKREDEVHNYEKRPKNFIHLEDVESIEDLCGEIKEVYTSKDMSLAYVVLSGSSKTHKHNIMQEVYHVIKGEGRLHLGEKSYFIEQGDTVSIPKNTTHFLETKEELEVLVVTTPKFIPEDVIEEEHSK